MGLMTRNLGSVPDWRKKYSPFYGVESRIIFLIELVRDMYR
jgi:hypothetical protein